jgi:RNA polymerase sigma-70 factor (ECF subfamily)
MERFEAMVAQCRNRIYSLAYYSLGSREEAEDVTQDVLVKLWEHWPSLDHERALPWTIRVAHNACLDVHRKRQVRRAASLNQCTGGNCPDGLSPVAGSNPETHLEQMDLRRQIETALQQIEEPYRTIVILREIQDMSYEQIGATMAMPLNTIKVYLHRGRRMLRDQIREKTDHGTVRA